MGHFVPLAELKDENIQCQAQTGTNRLMETLTCYTKENRAKKKERKKEKAITSVNSGPKFKRATWFTVSHGVLRLQTPFQLL